MTAREIRYTCGRYRLMLSLTGTILAMAGSLMLAPLLAALLWPGDGSSVSAYALPGLTLIGLGLLLRRLRSGHGTMEPLNLQEGGVIVLLSWIGVCAASAVPFVLEADVSITQAVFESVSGWTTTGLSVLDVTQASHALLLWRSTMQLAGGAGLAILMLAAVTAPIGTALHSAEGRDQLVPNVRQSANLVLRIYAGYVIAGIVGYVLAGMSTFDAINHAFAAVSTGGFSTRSDSIGYWDSPLVEAVTIPLMVLGNLNFVTAWLLLRGEFRRVLGNPELRLVGVLLPAATVGLFFLTCQALYPSLPKAIRVAIFETVTALTTTGFSTVGYGDWNGRGVYILILLMLIGGGICSTAGGIKQMRIYLLLKALAWHLRKSSLPPAAVFCRLIRDGERERPIHDKDLLLVSLFVFLYMMSLLLGTGIMVAYGYDLQSALFEFASTLGTVGLSVGVTSPDAPSPVLWTQIFGMLLGRLEFFVIFTAGFKLYQDVAALTTASVAHS